MVDKFGAGPKSQEAGLESEIITAAPGRGTMSAESSKEPR